MPIQNGQEPRVVLSGIVPQSSTTQPTYERLVWTGVRYEFQVYTVAEGGLVFHWECPDPALAFGRLAALLDRSKKD